MSNRPWTQWPAEEPPAQFADRVVGRLLEQPVVAAAPRRARRSWMLGLAAAAALAATTAWAMLHFRPSPAPPVLAPPAIVQPAAAPTPEPVHEPAALPEASTQPPPAPVRVPSGSAAPKPAPSASAPEPPASATVRHVPAPRCECGPGSFICTCVE